MEPTQIPLQTDLIEVVNQRQVIKPGVIGEGSRGEPEKKQIQNQPDRSLSSPARDLAQRPDRQRACKASRSESNASK